MIAVVPAAYNYVAGGAYGALYASILGPIFLTCLLMFLSGLPLQERPGAKKRYESGNNWSSYKEYTERTSILIPFPPQLYVRLPTVLKRTIFLEFPLYVFDPAKHVSRTPSSHFDCRTDYYNLLACDSRFWNADFDMFTGRPKQSPTKGSGRRRTTRLNCYGSI